MEFVPKAMQRGGFSGRGRSFNRGGGRGRYGGRAYEQRHDNGTVQAEGGQEVCKFFARHGNCKNGDSCR